jgi:ABC-type glycerol-3-phosphate transport system substrate-binding protein
MGAPRTSRRAALARAAAACAALLAPRTARPARASGVVRLTVALGYGGALEGAAALGAVGEYLGATFAARRPGVRVAVVPAPDPDRESPAYQEAVSAAVAGRAPDVLSGTDYQLPAFADAGVLLPLQPVIRALGLDLGRFAAPHLVALTRAPWGLVGLPAFEAPEVMLVNLSLLAALGVPAPDPDWTYLDATRAWTQATRDTAHGHLWGVSYDVEEYLTELFGGQVMDATGTRCLVASPAVLRAAEWFVPLVLRGIAYPIPNPPVADRLARQGRAAFATSPAQNVLGVVQDMRRLGADWDWLPMPRFPPLPPGRRLTYASGDWFGLYAHGPNRELAAELLAFLTTDPGFAGFVVRLAWVPPARVDLVPVWVRALQARAPVLADKHLAYYQDATRYEVPDRWFRYQPYEADSILRFWLLLIAQGRVTPARGLEAIAQAIDALEQGSGAPARTSAEG